MWQSCCLWPDGYRDDRPVAPTWIVLRMTVYGGLAMTGSADGFRYFSLLLCSNAEVWVLALEWFLLIP